MASRKVAKTIGTHRLLSRATEFQRRVASLLFISQHATHNSQLATSYYPLNCQRPCGDGRASPSPIVPLKWPKPKSIRANSERRKLVGQHDPGELGRYVRKTHPRTTRKQGSRTLVFEHGNEKSGIAVRSRLSSHPRVPGSKRSVAPTIACYVRHDEGNRR